VLMLTLRPTVVFAIPLLTILVAFPSLTQTDATPPTQNASGIEADRVKLIYSPVSPFPADGSVLLNLNVETDGKVSDVQALSGQTELYQTAVQSAKLWRFDPQAHAVDVKYVITYDNPKICPAAMSEQSVIMVGGLKRKENGVLLDLDPDDGGYLLHEYGKVRKSGVAGDMVLSFRIGPDGKIRKVRVIKSLTLNLDRAALKSTRKWKFTVVSGNPEFLPDDFELDVRFMPMCSGRGITISPASKDSI
jgi:TonB family protein